MDKNAIDMDIKTYIDERIEESEKRYHLETHALKESIDLRLEALLNLIEKAERLLEVRLAGLNEWREQNKAQTAKHATKQELQSGIDIIKAEYDGRLKVVDALLISLMVLVIGGFLLHIGIGG